MEASTKTFLVFRYSLIEESQRLLFALDPLETKGAMILPAIMDDIEFKYRGSTYSFLGFKSINSPYNSFEDNRFYVGKLAKLKETHVGMKVPGDIVDSLADDWIPLTVIVDTFEQYIITEKAWKFGPDDSIKNALQAGIRAPILERYGFTVFVEPKTTTKEFWSLIETNPKIYQLDLTLISPNILNTNKNAREALDEMQKLYDQEQVKISLKNNSGNLKVPKPIVANYVDYICEGEGKWALTIANDGMDKKTYTSDSNALSFDIDCFDEENYFDNDGQMDFDSDSDELRNNYSKNLLVEKIADLLKSILRRSDDD